MKCIKENLQNTKEIGNFMLFVNNSCKYFKLKVIVTPFSSLILYMNKEFPYFSLLVCCVWRGGRGEGGLIRVASCMIEKRRHFIAFFAMAI